MHLFKSHYPLSSGQACILSVKVESLLGVNRISRVYISTFTIGEGPVQEKKEYSMDDVKTWTNLLSMMDFIIVDGPLMLIPDLTKLAFMKDSKLPKLTHRFNLIKMVEGERVTLVEELPNILARL